MYEAFYSLNANPFRLTPDPRFCFSHPGYQRAREYLVYALKLGEGFIVITGQPGTGKTTLAETFLKELEVSKVAAERIVASNLGAMGLLRAVAFAFGLPAENIDRATLRSHIEQYFTRQVRGGRRALLIIDEAQGLPHSALEELRLLADLQSGTQPLLQIFLIGQHSLEDLLQVPEMNQFQQRVIATCHLKPLTLEETSAYMEYRLTQAGWKGDPEFTGQAVLSIYRYSQGIPRHINKLCNRLLLIGYGKEKHAIDREDVEEISTEMRLEKLTPISANESGRTDLSDVPFEAELPDDSLSLDSLALRFEGGAIETLDMAVEAEPNAEPEACSYSGETADWPVEVAAAAYPPEQPEHLPATGLTLAEKAGAGLYRWAMSAKRSLGTIGRLLIKAARVAAAVSTSALSRFAVAAKRSLGTIGRVLVMTVRVAAVVSTAALSRFAVAAKRSLVGIGRLLVKSVVVVVTIVVAFVSTAALTRFYEIQPGAGVITNISLIGDLLETATPDRPVATLEPAASVPDTGRSAPGTPAEKPVAMPPEPDLSPSVVAGTPRPVTAVPSPSPAPVPESREARIARLLGRARQSLERDRLLVPAGDNASLYYNRVLALDPGNRAALDGIDRIARRYAELASYASWRQDSGKARLYLERGLRVQPDNAELLVLRTTLDRPPASGWAEVVDRSIIASREPPKPFFSELKDLLGTLTGTAR
jgi:type II secretory pathway predicted ATPase ExeA